MTDDSAGITVPAYLLYMPSEHLEAEIRSPFLYGTFKRRSHMQYVPVDEAEQEAQKAWGERFRAVMSEGNRNYWINYGREDCEPANIITSKGTRVYDETSDEHFARVAPTIHALRKDA